MCDPRAAIARFTTISCLHLNERDVAIPGDVQQLRVELLLTDAHHRLCAGAAYLLTLNRHAAYNLKITIILDAIHN